MKKTYFVLLDKYSSEPTELKRSEYSLLTEQFSISCDEKPDGEMFAYIPAANMLLAFARAHELREQVINSGNWDVICENFRKLN